jgi:hypothetical protein
MVDGKQMEIVADDNTLLYVVTMIAEAPLGCEDTPRLTYIPGKAGNLGKAEAIGRKRVF